MRGSLILGAAAAAAILISGSAMGAEPPANVAAALADPARPAADRGLDAQRHAAEIVALAELQPGERAADVFPGGGYYTRIFARLVGPQGKVYAVVPKEAADKPYKPLDAVQKLAAEPAFANVSPLVQPMKSFDPPEKLDLVFISQFYHDMHNPDYGGPDIASVNRAVFNALKPGGIYLVVDHSAQAGSGKRDTGTIHRIDVEQVKSEVQAAGFVLEQASEVLRNPADPRTANVFAKEIRGKTDQFVLKFRKPAAAR